MSDEREDITADDLPPREQRRYGALIGWLLLGLAVTVMVVMVAVDLQHRNHYELVCQRKRATLLRGRRLPQPFGYQTVGGLFRPLKLLTSTLCAARQDYDSREEAESAYLELIVAQARHALGEPPGDLLTTVRQQLRQALHITRDEVHRSRRATVVELMADLNYKQGRAALGRVESDLRAARAWLFEADKLAGRRYRDVRQWISHIDALLRSISPVPPGKAAPSSSAPRPAFGPPSPSPAPPGAPTATTDAGPGGVLM